MKLAYLSAAALLITAGAAMAQTTQKAHGGNLPAGQGPCSRGYEQRCRMVAWPASAPRPCARPTPTATAV